MFTNVYNTHITIPVINFKIGSNTKIAAFFFILYYELNTFLSDYKYF